ncbi:MULTISPECIES: YciI family protein [Zymobacter]|uniref:Uncharacterized protein conserved in bacteria n=1 Tax=Zymobacter palmae TaxID=33074 RepID=A0A348HFW4_9GAMM|nr:YciI family protein [Zymobacter palmae]BBG30516.1 uncharacterized protein conserved in bacteria [Zymobacter palmae]
MLYAIMSEDVLDSTPLRKPVRPAHLARLDTLRDEGRLAIAGPFPFIEGEGVTGSLVVAEFDSYEAALQWANTDPYVDAGVYAKVVVKPFRQVLP